MSGYAKRGPIIMHGRGGDRQSASARRSVRLQSMSAACGRNKQREGRVCAKRCVCAHCMGVGE